jgi:CBS domain-containing protein
MRVSDVMQRDVITIDEMADVALALQIMVYNEVRHLPVLREGEVVGILSERDVLSARRTAGNGAESPATQGGLFELQGKVGDLMTRQVKSIHPRAGLEEAAARMAVEKIGCLLVFDDQKMVGLLTRADVLATAAQCPVDLSEGPEPDIGSMMTTKIAAVHEDDRLVDAASMMLRWGVRHLPVIDGLKRVRGILSDRDVRTALGNPLEAVTGEATSRRVEALRVQDVMTPEPHTVRADEPVSSVVAALVNELIGAMPVVDEEDHLVGMISYVDVLRRLQPLLGRQ